MSSEANSALGPLTALDFISAVASRPDRPLDFLLVLRCSARRSLSALRRGAQSARHRYPTTGSRVEGRGWRWASPDASLTLEERAEPSAVQRVAERWMRQPLDPARDLPVAQVLLTSDGTTAHAVLTRFHHVACDGLSALLWLAHQHEVARGGRPAEDQLHSHHPPSLLRHPSPARRSVHAFPSPSARLWSPGTRATGERGWVSFIEETGELRERLRAGADFSFNDLLAACVLEVFAAWNERHGAKRAREVGLWLPVDVRTEPLQGFGNGASRVRVYLRWERGALWTARARSIRGQRAWSREHGEWAVPERHPVLSLPPWLSAPLLRAYLDRPGVDMGTGVLSHVERLGETAGLFGGLDWLDVVGPLHPAQGAAFNGVSVGSHTRLTLTYDVGRFGAAEAGELVALFRELLADARRAGGWGGGGG